jgi:hypothetical protein
MLVRLQNKLFQNPEELEKSGRPKTSRQVGFSSMIYIELLNPDSRMSHIILNPIQPQSLQVARISKRTWILLRQRGSDVPLSSRYHLEGKI